MSKMKQVFEDNFRIKEALEKAPFPDGIYMSIHFNNGKAFDPQKRPGLDYTLEKLAESPETPLILYGFELISNLFFDRRFMRVMSHANAHYARAPFRFESIAEMLSVPTFRNQALEIASDHEEKVNLISVLRHDYKHRPREVMEIARREYGLAFEKTDQEIVDFIHTYEGPPPRRELGRIRGVFADVEDTLLKDEEINPDIVKLLIKYSQKHPVTLWTGGDHNIAKSILPKFAKACIEQGALLYLRTGVVSKHIFRESHPEIVIDDLTQTEFERQYRMKPETYIHAKT